MKITNVSVGIFVNQSKVLLGKRPLNRPWHGWWEFPGGKIKLGEKPQEALMREIKEELGVIVEKPVKWLTRLHYYDNQPFRLHFFKIFSWKNTPLMREHDELKWVDINKPSVGPILPANQIIFKSLALPTTYAITNMNEFKGNFMSTLKKHIELGMSLIQIREKEMKNMELEIFSKKILDIKSKYQFKVLINSNLDLARRINADGLHLNSNQLYQKIDLPKGMIKAASCHSIDDLKQAEKISCDFALLSPVKKTLSHPQIKPMGWYQFQKIINQVQIPVYALGGMSPDDIRKAQSRGSVGIASQRAIWN